MTVALNVQPLLYKEKTGIGWYTANIVRNLTSNYPDTKYYIDGFHSGAVDADTNQFFDFKNAQTRLNPFPRSVYRLLSTFLPVPYSAFFRGDQNITHFFNYVLPPFVKGKTVVTIHDMVYRRFPETVNRNTKYMLRFSLEKTLRRVDKIITISRFSKEEILAFYPISPECIEVIYCGVDHDIYHPNIEDSEKKRVREKFGIKDDYILYLGALEPRKNISRLIAAYEQLKARRKAPILVIAGPKGWMYDEIFNQAASLGDSVVFTDYVPNGDKPGLLAGARCFCFPSLYEGFGLPPLEAMACGVPVVASNAASLPEVVGNGGLMVDPYDVSALSNAIERLCYDDDTWLDLHEKGLVQASGFNWPDAADRLHHVYKELVYQ